MLAVPSGRPLCVFWDISERGRLHCLLMGCDICYSRWLFKWTDRCCCLVPDWTLKDVCKVILPLLSSVNVTLSVTLPESEYKCGRQRLITFSLWLDRCCCVWDKDSDVFSGMLPDGRFQWTMYRVSPSGSLCEGKLPEGLRLATSGQ